MTLLANFDVYYKYMHKNYFKFHCLISIKYYLILFCLYTSFRRAVGKNNPNKKVGLPYKYKQIEGIEGNN